jgi:hypothetical protein
MNKVFFILVGLLGIIVILYREDKALREPKRPIRKGWLDEDAAVEEAKNIIAGIK